MAISLQHQDTFNRSDGSLHGSTFSDGLGQWSSPPSGQINVDGNRAVQASNISDQGIFDNNMDGGTTDQRAVVEVLNADTGPIVRHNGLDSGNEEYYHAYFAFLSVGIYVREAGGFTLLGTAGSASVNDDVGLEVIGDDLQAYLNGSTLGSPVTNATLTAGRCGMYFGGGTGQAQDNFEAWWEEGGGAYTLTADAGSFTVTGQDADLDADRKIIAETSSFPVTAQDAGLLLAKKLVAESGGYTLTGTDASLEAARAVIAESGTYTYTAQDVGLREGFTLSCESGTFTVTPTDTSLITLRIIDAEVGEFALTAQDATLIYTESGFRLTAEVAEFVVTGTETDLVRDSGILSKITVGRWSVRVTLNPGDEWRVLGSGPSADAPEVRIDTQWIDRG